VFRAAQLYSTLQVLDIATDLADNISRRTSKLTCSTSEMARRGCVTRQVVVRAAGHPHLRS
jgi:Tfp pilus assembly protein PilV